MRLQYAQATLAAKLQFGNLNQLEALENMAAAEACVKHILDSLEDLQNEPTGEIVRAPECAEDAYFCCFKTDREDALLGAFDCLSGGLDWQICTVESDLYSIAAEWQKWIVAEAKRRWEQPL